VTNFFGTGAPANHWQSTTRPRPSQINRRVREIRGTAAMRAATRRYDRMVSLCLAWKAGCVVLLVIVIATTKPELAGPDLSDLIGSVLLGALMLAILVLAGVLIANQSRAAQVVRREAIRQLTTPAG
jgi:hypothetical protein